MREVCAGINCDLGTSAAFRDQWKREAEERDNPTPIQTPTHLLLRTNQAPGDAVAMTAAIYSLHKAHPGKYTTAVESYWPEVFKNNPDVVEHYMPPKGDESSRTLVHMHYPAIHSSNERGIHFMQGWCEFLGSALDIPVPLLTNRPHLYFDSPTPPQGDFWLVCSGGKRDFTNKLWGHHNYQEVVNSLIGYTRFVQVGGSRPPVPWNESTKGSQEDDHKPLENVSNLLGKTSLRDLFNLVRRAKGVLCGVSLLMHVAAALNKPAIVIAGGREPVAWNAYPKQHYLHTVGMLPCHDSRGRMGGACWRYRVVPLGDGTVMDDNVCERPQSTISGAVPQCMALITPERVVELIRGYENG